MTLRSLAITTTGLLIALSLSSCSSVRADAATVDGHRIPMSQFEDDITAIQTLNTLPSDRVQLSSARRILTLEIWILRTQDQLSALGTPVTAALRTQAEGQFKTDPSWASTPPHLQQLEIELQATQVAAQGNADVKFPTNTSVWVNPSVGKWDAASVITNQDGSIGFVGGVVALDAPPATLPATPTDTVGPTDSAAPSADTVQPTDSAAATATTAQP